MLWIRTKADTDPNPLSKVPPPAKIFFSRSRCAKMFSLFLPYAICLSISRISNEDEYYEYLLSDISVLKGVGIKTTNLLKKKKINNIFDLLWKLPKSYTDRSLSTKIKELRIGENQTVTIIPQKYSFPRVRNLPNRVLCSDETGEMDCIFFNSYEGYVKKILPIGKEVTISGKIGIFRNKYQLTNPKYISENSL